MHEAAITEALIEQVRGFLPGGGRLIRCVVEVGALEHVEHGVMGALWTAMTADSPLAGGELVLETVPLAVRCGGCGEDFEPEDRAILVCPSCGVVRPEVRAGVGIVLRTVEIEEAE